MSKATLHNLIDMLNESDISTIYNVLLRFIPATPPADDEVRAIEQAEQDIKNGDVIDLATVKW